MKIFRKKISQNGRQHIYFCGIKIASCKYYKKHNYIKKQNYIPEVLCYTYANEKYFPFAILYPLFVINSNENISVEIIIDNYKSFYTKYAYLIEYYEKTYPDKVFFHPYSGPKCRPGTKRFITQPLWRGKYVYIGDIDIMITQEIAKPHIENIKKFNLDFSNIKRKGQNKLSGLHFIEYDKMYPIKIPKHINLKKINDEIFLLQMMQFYGYKIPDENKCTFRPILGMHFSYYSRPPLPTLTTFDKNIETVFPSWFDSDKKISLKNAKSYLDLRYNKNIVNFMQKIKPTHIELRKIIQYMDMSCWFFCKSKQIKTIKKLGISQFFYITTILYRKS